MPPHLEQALPRMNIPIFGPLPESVNDLARISGLGLVSVSFSHQLEAGDPHRLGIFFQLA